ncbi:dihydrofolate reductase family protein [Nonomuraea sp. NPDC049152]|uniref:dihydrofolate reductase family protein n=1 Tax=Nonomuraea sp. NPDC049152 TaxID=3154350 RepID=UPI0033EA81F4
MRRADVHKAVAEPKDRPGKDILMFGRRTLWNDLLVTGLVDELHLMDGATVLCGGTPAFGAGPVPPLRLMSTRRRDDSDNVLLRYKVVGHGA